MSSIKVIDSIRISPKGVLVKDANGKYVILHRRQGHMDGACAVYSLSMALLCIGAVTEEDLDIFNKPDRRTPKGKFLSHFLDEQGMVRSGYSYSTLRKEINEQSFGIRVRRRNPRDKEKLIGLIADTLDEDKPVIISTVFTDGAHAMLAVGYEFCDKNGAIMKFLCLDPSEEAPTFSSWNCIIDVSHIHSKSEFPFDNITKSQSYKVALRDILIIENKK
jgi:hypothetical protein